MRNTRATPGRDNANRPVRTRRFQATTAMIMSSAICTGSSR